MLYPVFIISSIAIVANNAVVRIPLQKIFQTQHVWKTDAIHGGRKLYKTPPRMPLTNYLNTQYYIAIAIGTPKQHFTVQIDTGSQVSWVPSINCKDPSNGCYLHHKYESQKSQTYRRHGHSYTINYTNDAFVSGYIAIDDIWVVWHYLRNKTKILNHLLQFGESSRIKQAFFVETLRDSGGSFGYTMFDGVLGLPSYKHCSSVFYKMIQQRVIKKAIFSIYINRIQNSFDGGEILFGSTNRNLYQGNLMYFPISKNKINWLLDMNLVKLKNDTLCTEGCYASIDSGTSYIGVPNEHLARIKRILNIPQYHNHVRCNQTHKLPPITFVFGGKEFVLTPNDYVETPIDRHHAACLIGFVSIEPKAEKPVWTIGQSFMGKYYTVFDAENFRLGLALAAHNQ